MISPFEAFSPTERDRLGPHFSNLDQPVFALINLPETVKAAMFARYSRYPGTLRRLFLDEFAGDMPAPGVAVDGDAGARATALFERVFVGHGDDSVAQLDGAHIACEYVSNIMTKVLERPRLGAYLEQSTRYIAYDTPVDGLGYRYFRDPELGVDYEQTMDLLFDTYASMRPRVEAWVREQFSRPRATHPPRTRAQSAPRRWTSSAACCRRHRCRTSASTPRARPTSSSSCTCWPTRCPRPATVAGSSLTRHVP